MEIRDIRYFKAVAAHLNLGRAAEALDMSTTALSKSLRRLEKSVGGKLVRRTSKGVELTEVGVALYTQSARLQLVLDDIRHESADLAGGRAGRISVCATNGLAEHCVAEAYRVLLREAPNVALKVAIVNSGRIDSMLQGGEVDFIVNTVRPVTPAGIVGEELFVDYRVPYVAANHPLAKRKRVTLADLAKECWASDIDASSWNILCRFFESKGLQPPRLLLESNSLELRLPLIASSHLVAHTSSMVLRRAQRHYPLVELKVDGMQLVRRMGVHYRKDGYLSPAAKRMIEILKEQGRAISANRRRHA